MPMVHPPAPHRPFLLASGDPDLVDAGLRILRGYAEVVVAPTTAAATAAVESVALAGIVLDARLGADAVLSRVPSARDACPVLAVVDEPSLDLLNEIAATGALVAALPLERDACATFLRRALGRGERLAHRTRTRVADRFATEHGLSARQREVLTQLVHGHSRERIATRLELSRKTVDNHLVAILATSEHTRISDLVLALLRQVEQGTRDEPLTAPRPLRVVGGDE